MSCQLRFNHNHKISLFMTINKKQKFKEKIPYDEPPFFWRYTSLNFSHSLSTIYGGHMKQDTWPERFDTSRYRARPMLSIINKKERSNRYMSNCLFRTTPTSTFLYCRDFSGLPFDILTKIAASFSLSNLQTASLVCRAWRDALRPLRQAMLFLKWGKRFKHGRGGVKVNLEKALESFLKGAALGSSLAMVDAGLLYWELGKREKAIALYRKAAELGDAAGQCNLGISYLQADPPRPKEAIWWLFQASVAGHVRAQYQLALCLHQGRGVDRNLQEAARWYLTAASGGYVRAMYNVALCYSVGEGLGQSHRQARKWMKRAADRGHSKAQFEHGLSLFSEGEMLKAVVYLELATRAGETAASHVKNVILQQLSAASRDRVIHHADNWRALPSSH